MLKSYLIAASVSQSARGCGLVGTDCYSYLIVFLVALVVTMGTTPLARRIAIRLGAIDYPSARRVNKRATPRMGGIAIFFGLMAALVTQYVGTLTLGWPSAFIPHPTLDVNYWGLAVAALVIFMTGAIDDVVGLKAWQKLLGQALGAVIAAASGLTIANVVDPLGPGALELGWIGYPITVVYLVSFANIINLIDGLDGLAAGISAIVGLSLFGIMIMADRVDAAALAIALAGACIGFLRWNFHPASIFMGDSGALTLGFLLGVVSLLGVRRAAAITTLLVPLIIAGVPILDTAAAIIRRKRGHVSIGQPDKGHIQHRLIQHGFDQTQAALLMYSWSALLSIGAFVITQVEVGPRIAVFVALLAVSLAFVGKLNLLEPVLRHYYKSSPDAQPVEEPTVRSDDQPEFPELED